MADSSTVTLDVNSAPLAGAGASRPDSAVVPGSVNGRRSCVSAVPVP
ncbi:hypothetical protein [Streptomyces olivaceoviridis]